MSLRTEQHFQWLCYWYIFYFGKSIFSQGCTSINICLFPLLKKSWNPVISSVTKSHNLTKCSLSLQALCFEAYFQEDVSEAQDETYRIRKCKIYFYLEDDTMQVVEPECKNSGIPQGVSDKCLVNVAQMKMFYFSCTCTSSVLKIPTG